MARKFSRSSTILGCASLPYRLRESANTHGLLSEMDASRHFSLARTELPSYLTKSPLMFSNFVMRVEVPKPISPNTQESFHKDPSSEAAAKVLYDVVIKGHRDAKGVHLPNSSMWCSQLPLSNTKTSARNTSMKLTGWRRSVTASRLVFRGTTSEAINFCSSTLLATLWRIWPL